MSNRGATQRKRRRGDRGQSLVEFALVIPLFLLILFGILEFGFLLYSRITLINATREGARTAVTQVDNPQGIPPLVKSQIQANITALRWSDVTVVVTCANASGNPACDFASGGAADPMPGDSVNVATSYVYRPFFARFFVTTVNLGTTVRMVLE
jgi:Flp pilus assembly protein TadG